MTKTEKAIQWMEATARDDSHGYCQTHRWGTDGDYDCSSAVITAWEYAGVPVKTAGATYTGNMRTVFLKQGFKDVTASVNRATGAGLQRGDVLLNDVHHTAMYCGNGLEVEASINEKGTATGGTPGDQTGREFLIRSYRNYPWTHVLRYAGDQTMQAGLKSVDEIAKEVLAGKWGNGDSRKNSLEAAGYSYSQVQAAVNKLMGVTGTPKPATPSNTYKNGNTYTLKADALRVRTGAGTGYRAKTYKELSANARKNAYSNGTLKKGTRVTCMATKKVENDIWIQIPSGWIAAYYGGKRYVG